MWLERMRVYLEKCSDRIGIFAAEVCLWLSSPPSPTGPLFHSILTYLESNLVTFVGGIFGSLLAVIFPKVLYGVGAILVLAAHRHGVVKGRSRVFQFFSYAILSLLIALSVHALNPVIQRKLVESNNAFAQLIVSKLPNNYTRPAPTGPVSLPPPGPSSGTTPPNSSRRRKKDIAGPANSEAKEGPNDPDLKLLADSEKLFMSAQNWHTQTIKDRGAQEERVRREYKEMGRDEAATNFQIGFTNKLWWDDTLKDYQQTYAPELIRLRREMIAIAPNAGSEHYGDFGDWQNPPNSGGITGIVFNFLHVLSAYRVKLQSGGKISNTLTEEEKKMSPVQRQMLGSQVDDELRHP